MEAANRSSKYPNLMLPWKPGQSGNPVGKLKGFARVMKDLLKKTELCGEPLPGGRTAEQCLAEACLLRAIKDGGRDLDQVLNRVYGPEGDLGAALQRAIFEIIPNNRDAALPIEPAKEELEQPVIDVTPKEEEPGPT